MCGSFSRSYFGILILVFHFFIVVHLHEHTVTTCSESYFQETGCQHFFHYIIIVYNSTHHDYWTSDIYHCVQRRTQKIFLGFSFSGMWWLLVFGMRFLWRHNLTSHSCFQTNTLAMFVDAICVFFHAHSPYFMCYCIEYKVSALQVRISEENTLNTTTQQFVTAKI